MAYGITMGYGCQIHACTLWKDCSHLLTYKRNSGARCCSTSKSPRDNRMQQNVSAHFHGEICFGAVAYGQQDPSGRAFSTANTTKQNSRRRKNGHLMVPFFLFPGWPLVRLLYRGAIAQTSIKEGVRPAFLILGRAPRNELMGGDSHCLTCSGTSA